MVAITYISHDGSAHAVDAQPGLSLMEAAVRNNVPGIDADCAGACACATCHVFVDDAWRAAVGPASEMETVMLEFADGVRRESRLACQIRIIEAFDGLTVTLPEGQA